MRFFVGKSVLLLLVSALSPHVLAEVEHPHQANTHEERSYTGKITIHNQSGYDGTFSIWGDNCWIWYPVHMSELSDGDGPNPLSAVTTLALNVAQATHTKEIACQEVAIKNNSSYTFYIDKANTFGSEKLHPKAFFNKFGFYWWCIDKSTNRYIGHSKFGAGEYLSSTGEYDITFSKDYKRIWSSYYCDVHETQH